ncbi:hypothetical protein HCN44_008779 [Aphidius gifuensis]|uniref:Uncharacterized protein n=1 Tax=Aphidius gifuensis TaxID=684658 RepID=A0A834XRZ7_APHGI|nr:uncharacterized protein LOC122855477 [Aphidius gifuensis]KAF7991467.1 hypothetical protein HCN44_008779 [Aphidius gifuensis]
MEIRLIIHYRKVIYDDFDVTPGSIKNHINSNEDNQQKNTLNTKIQQSIVNIKFNKHGLCPYVVGGYVSLLKSSCVYRQLAHKYLAKLVSSDPSNNNNKTVVILLKLKKYVDKEFLDYKWNERITILALEQREIDYAMSWLSTLGGAFSSQGFNNKIYAETAGKISIHQFKLALRLGNPLLVSRCQLYACLSLIQQGHFKLPRKIIPKIYKFSIKEKDKHLGKMCQGIWATLQYTYSLRKNNK